jgi:hypothetical protein
MYELLINQGATLNFILSIKDSNNDQIDFTGHTFRGQIRKSAASPDILASFTFSVRNQTTSTGVVDVSLSAAETSAIPVATSSRPEKRLTTYAFDIESESSDGHVTRWLEGLAIVSPEVTK